MDLDKLLKELRGEVGRLERAIATLLGVGVAGKKGKGRSTSKAARKKRRGLTAAEKKRMSAAMKKSWAMRKKMGS